MSHSSKEIFNKIEKNSYYLRVDDVHPLELLIGLNDEGKKSIRFIGDFVPTKIKSSRIIDVKHYKLHDKIMLNFSLLDIQYIDLFYLFCDDLIESSRSIPQSQGYTFIVNRYEKWRTFGSTTKKFLSENEIKGLIGELFFIKSFLLRKYGSTDTISGWTGTEPTKKDFYYADYWYEIKTSTKSQVTISSLEQLDGTSNGYLVVYNLEKMSPEANGLSIKYLAEEIINSLQYEHTKTEFLMKLIDAGFYFEEYYDSFIFDCISYDVFLVDSNFPRLTKDNIPPAITAVKYDLVLNMLEDFREEIK